MLLEVRFAAIHNSNIQWVSLKIKLYEVGSIPYTRDPQIWTIPAEFSSNPNQTHLSMLIRVFKIIRKSQVGEFDQSWS